jgi:hypothetical protein
VRRYAWPAALLLGLLLPAQPAAAQDPALPVFFLRYDGGLGYEEIAAAEGEEEEIEPCSQRHRVTLRIKEEWSDSLVTNLTTAVSRKTYTHEKGSYTYFYLYPDLAWEISGAVKWTCGFRSKFTAYDEPDEDGHSKDVTALLAKTGFTFKAAEGLKIMPAYQAVFDLHEYAGYSRATQTFGLGISSAMDALRLSARYRGILRDALGEASTVDLRFNNEFGLNLSWDPNR